jgi:hypothetical protein
MPSSLSPRPLVLLTCIALLASGSAIAATDAVVISVETTGADSANGDAASGPVKTLPRAQALARSHIAAMAAGTEPRRPVRVLIGPGDYPLAATLSFTPADSGTADAPVSYEARQAGSVLISGGNSLGSQTAAQPGATLTFPAPADDAAMAGGSQLFVNGRRATLARQPKAGDAWFVQSAVTLPGEPAGKQGMEAFTAAPASLAWINVLSAADRKRAIVEVYQSWTTGKHRLSSQPAPNGALRIAPRALWPFLSLGGTSQRYFIENVVAALDAPGEWIYGSGAVRYIPRPDEAGKPLQATVPVLEKLVVVQGEAGKPVTHLHFVGLTFAHTRYLVPEAGVTDNQAAYIVGAAIEVNRASGFVFSHGSVQHTGGWGLWLRDGVRDAQVTDSSFTDLGAGGIKVGLASQPPGDGSATGAAQIVGNTISDTGQVFPSAVGIFVGQSWDNQLLRNTIHDTSYTGISVGWTWGYAAATSGRNLVKGNLIYNIGQRQLSDLAGIYTLGRSPGTVIANNIVRNVRGYSGYGAGAWGIYNDEGSSGILMEGNVVVDTDSGGYHLHFGKDNILRGNILAGGEAAEIRVTKPEADTHLTVQGNLLAPKTLKPLDQFTPGPQVKFDGNEVTAARSGKGLELDKCGGGCALGSSDLQAGAAPTDIRSSNPAWMGVIHTAVAAWSGGAAPAKGMQGRSLLSDSAGNAASDDAPGSTRTTRSLPAVAEAPKALLAPAADLVVDIAGTLAGGRPANLQYAPKDKPAGIQVEAQDGAPNGKCLAFNDGPAFTNRWEPYATALLNHTQGSTTVDFELKTDATTALVVEWRDNATPYAAGPSLRITAAGVEVGGKVVAPLAVGRWTKVRMTAPVGADNPSWSLELSPADGRRVTVGGLAAKSGAWRRLNALVFSSDAVVESHPCVASIRAANDASR